MWIAGVIGMAGGTASDMVFDVGAIVGIEEVLEFHRAEGCEVTGNFGALFGLGALLLLLGACWLDRGLVASRPEGASVALRWHWCLSWLRLLCQRPGGLNELIIHLVVIAHLARGQVRVSLSAIFLSSTSRLAIRRQVLR